MVTPGRRGRKFFYNEFISAILFGEESSDGGVAVLDECKEILERVAFVSIDMTRADAIVYTKVEDVPIYIPTVAGGLLSLYMGVSLMSMVEVAAIFIRLCFVFVKTLVPTFNY